jgi:hypothetical protein
MVSGSVCATMSRIFFSSTLRLINEQMTANAQIMSGAPVCQEAFETLPAQCRSSTFSFSQWLPNWMGSSKNHHEILFVLQLLTTKWTFDISRIDLWLKLSIPITIMCVHCSNIPGMRHKEVRKSFHCCFTVP